MGTKNGKWDGKGNPPNLQAAIAWLETQGLTHQQATTLIPTSGTSMSRLGTAARRAAQVAETEHRGFPSISTTDLPYLGLPGQSRSSGKKSSGGTKADASGSAVVDANGDGKISDDVAASAGLGGDILAGLPAPGQGNTRGAALWPYQASDDALAGLTVENRSTMDSIQAGVENYKAAGLASGKRQERIGARYFEADTLAPLRWSQEQRADLQRLMQGIGLYGDKKVRLGTWGAEDQAIFAEVLAASNVEGTRWVETLAGWRKNPPVDLLEQIRGEQPKRPTIRVTNPVDIRQNALDVSRQMIGREADSFAQGVVGKYQGAEVAAQQAVIADQDAGGGGQVADAPSLGNFAKEELERTAGAEVDAYKFLGNFNALLQRVGLAG